MAESMEEKDWLIIALDGSWRVVQATDMWRVMHQMCYMRDINEAGFKNIAAIVAVETLRDAFSEACTHDSLTIGEKVIDCDIWNDGDGHVDSNGPYVNYEGFEQWMKKILAEKKPKI